jgi:hypothetical protein
MPTQSQADQTQALRTELAKANEARRELAETLSRLLKHMPTYEIEHHGGYRYAAALVAENFASPE